MSHSSEVSGVVLTHPHRSQLETIMNVLKSVLYFMTIGNGVHLVQRPRWKAAGDAQWAWVGWRHGRDSFVRKLRSGMASEPWDRQEVAFSISRESGVSFMIEGVGRA